MQIRTLSSERDPRKIKNSQIMTQEPFTNVSRKPRKNLQVQSKIVLSTNNHASRAGFSWCTKIVHRKKSVSFNKVSCTSRTWNQHTWTFETRTLETNTPHSMRKNQRSVRISPGASHTSYSCSTALGREPFRPIQFRPLHLQLEKINALFEFPTELPIQATLALQPWGASRFALFSSDPFTELKIPNPT